VHNVYIADDTDCRLLAAVMAIEETFTGRIENFQVVEALGLVGGIWPASVQLESDQATFLQGAS
jgi:hypothetical protein